jgi:hypothetical protein
VIQDHDMPTALWLVDYLVAPITWESINTLMEYNSAAQQLAATFLHEATSLLKKANSDLDSIYATLYNGTREAGLKARAAKPLPQAVLENAAKGHPRYLEQRAIAQRLEYCRDILRDLRDNVSSRSRHLDQISNNLRFEGRIDA